MKQSSQKTIFVALAEALADVLESPETPAPLRDALTEATAELVNLLSEDHGRDPDVVLLRGLACLAKRSHITTRAKAETLNADRPERKAATYTH